MTAVRFGMPEGGMPEGGGRAAQLRHSLGVGFRQRNLCPHDGVSGGRSNRTGFYGRYELLTRDDPRFVFPAALAAVTFGCVCSVFAVTPALPN